MIAAFADAGANIISFHPEASRHIDRSLSLIKDKNIQAALALNPATPLNILENVMDKLDMILLMSVNPGFGGQKFIPAMRDKIRRLRQICDEYEKQTGRHIPIEVDGGVNANNINDLVADGAEIFVAGSAVFGQKDYVAAISALKRGSLKG